MSTANRDRDRYVLSHRRDDVDEDHRLTTQHGVIQQAMLDDQLFHPSIPVVQIKNAIADFGCGTGVWLEDVRSSLLARHDRAEEDLPKLVGFDMNTLAFKASPGSSVQFVEHDCTRPFSKSYMGTFDLVNMRGLAYALTAKQFSHLVGNAFQLLRPGGYIQWLETESTLFKCYPETQEITMILDAMNLERQQRELASYLPHLMVREVLSLNLRLHLNWREIDEEPLSILNFNLLPGGISREGRSEEVAVNSRLSDILLETMKIFLSSSLIRIMSQTSGTIDDESQETQRLMAFIDKVRMSEEVKMGGLFPQLIAQKSTGQRKLPQTVWN